MGAARATSAANDGPDSTTTGRTGPSSCSMTSDIRFSVPVSKPLVALTTVVPGPTAAAARRNSALAPWDGTASTTASAPSTASSRDAVGETAAGIGAPGRYVALTRSRRNRSTRAASLPHRCVRFPTRAK